MGTLDGKMSTESIRYLMSTLVRIPGNADLGDDSQSPAIRDEALNKSEPRVYGKHPYCSVDHRDHRVTSRNPPWRDPKTESGDEPYWDDEPLDRNVLRGDSRCT